jgi:hypothetical protein
VKPRDLLLARFRESVVPALEGRGFRFSASKLAFTRTVGIAKQRIDVSLDRHNAADDCTFWTMWETSAPAYAKWHAAEWGRPPRGDGLASSADWNIPGWTRGVSHFRLRNAPADAEELRVFLEHVERAGLPFLDRVSTWEGAAEHCRAQRWLYDVAADFLLIAGDPERAREVLLEGLRTFTTGGRHDALQELPRIRARLERYFPGAEGSVVA